ncbi:MAG: ABC transporter ATP-binding protein [Desulfobacterales bacterium]|nr:ABC transporter ATP-binding protein [Desulfobacterales bacterium]
MLTIKKLKKNFVMDKSTVQAVKGVDLELAEGEFFVLLGASGSGKSTILRCVAGLERPESGEMIIGDKVVYSSERGISVPAYQRSVGMVFQSYAIWPHMTVGKNVSFPLEQGRNKLPRNQIKGAVQTALAKVKLADLENRPAPLLSGGQQQRVALARALVTNPTLFLLDEPLSNLDAKLREEMRFELKELTSSLGITTLYVTHDQLEGLAMADRIGVILEGNILEVGPPHEIYSQPKTRKVAEFMGTSNMIYGKVTRCEYPIGTVETGIGAVEAALCAGLQAGSEIAISIRPEDVEVHIDQRPSGSNVFEAVVENAVFLGSNINAKIMVKDKMFLSILKSKKLLSKGQKVWIQCVAEYCIAVK